MRDSIGWLLLGVIALAAVSLFVADRVQRVREQEALWSGACEDSAMVESVRSYKTTVWAVALVLPFLGVCASAALTRRLKPELYGARRGTGNRILLGLLASLLLVLVFSVGLFLLGGTCLAVAVSRTGLSVDVASGILSVVGGRFVPNFWISSTLEVLVVSVLTFLLYSKVLRLLTSQLARVRRS